LKGVDFMQATIQKWGNSQAIRLPKAILDIARLKENEQVQITAELDRIIIKKSVARKHRTLAERLEGFEGEYEFEEWDTGAPVGREVW
jgi:antitoxin MazE